jgi:thiosulfate dehydrogenase
MTPSASPESNPEQSGATKNPKEKLDLRPLLGLLRSLLLLLVFNGCLMVYLVWFTVPAPWVQETWTAFSSKIRAAWEASETTDSEVASGLEESGSETALWTAPDPQALPNGPEKDLILYGRDLIEHTAKYFGPKGSVKAGATNGMNCQNCHLKAGTQPFGNNYSAVASTYPKYRARSGAVENLYKRVNDCFERSLNGQALDTNGAEMAALVAYIQFLGKEVPKGEKPEGSGLKKLAFLNRAADPLAGEKVYAAQCARCHKSNGQGVLAPDGIEYTYPPMWGAKSYNTGAGLYRLSNFAKYVKYNMPQGVEHTAPVLTDEEAWDLAAFVNSQPRPGKDISRDWPRIEEKPFDHPFGPFADAFTEKEHKYGPFGPIEAAAEARKVKNGK